MSIADVDDLATTIEEELAAVLHAAGLRGRQACAVKARLGWDGAGGRTLAGAAAAEGYSRERVRQLETRVRDHAARTHLEVPAATRALRVLEEAAPIGAEPAARQLAARGHARGPFAVHGLLTAAEVLGLDTGVHLRNGVVLRVGDGGIAETLVVRARRVVRRRGATRVEEIALAMGAGTRTVRRLLELQPDVHWLDERHSWFVFEGAESRATRSLEKMLSVSTNAADRRARRGAAPVVPRRHPAAPRRSQRLRRAPVADARPEARHRLDERPRSTRRERSRRSNSGSSRSSGQRVRRSRSRTWSSSRSVTGSTEAAWRRTSRTHRS